MARALLTSIILFGALAINGDAQGPVTGKTLHLVIHLPSVSLAGASTDPTLNPLAVLYSRLAQLVIAEDWPEITVDAGDTLAGIIARRYRLNVSDVLHRPAISIVAQMISDVNTIKDPNFIQAGAVLKVPVLPLFPSDKSGAGPLQVLSSGRLRFLPLTSLGNLTAAGQATPQGEPGRTLVIALGDSRATLILSTLQDAYRYGILAGDAAPTVPDRTPLPPTDIDFLEAPTNDEPSLLINDAIRNRAGVLYIVDFFSGECSHGQRVAEVVTDIFSKHSAAALVPNVVGIDLAPTNPPSTYKAIPISVIPAPQLIDQYVNTTLGPDDRKTFLGTLRNTSGTAASSAQTLQLIYRALADPESGLDARVVSSSFYLVNHTQQLPPPTFTEASWPLMFAAVSDFQIYVEDNKLEDPARGFFNARDRHAVALVGSAVERLGAVVNKGMISRLGTGVGFVASGVGRCGQLPDFGTSFATPRVAAYAFLAQAIWPEESREPDGRVGPLEALTRLKVASRIQPALVGKYASAGAPDLARLVAAGASFVIHRDGRIAEATVTGRLRDICLAAPNQEQTIRSRVPVLSRTICPTHLGALQVRAIQILAGRVFVFVYDEHQWLEVTPIDSSARNIEIEVRLKGSDRSDTFESLNDLAMVFQGVVSQ